MFNPPPAHGNPDSPELRHPGFGTDDEILTPEEMDRDPTYAPRSGGATPIPTDPGLFDQVGRMFRVGVRTRF